MGILLRCGGIAIVLANLSGCATSGPIVGSIPGDSYRDEKTLTIQCDERHDGAFIRRVIEDHLFEISPFGKYRNTKFKVDCSPERSTSDLVDVKAKTQHLRKRIAASGRKRIVLVIHGGLVPRENGVSEAIALARAMLQDDNFDGYPIFINWRSGGLDAYGEQAMFIRKGRYNPLVGLPTFPFKVASDVAKGLVEAPTAMALVGNRVVDSFGDGINECRRQAEPGELQVICPSGATTPTVRARAQYLSTAPLRLASGPLVHGVGRAAWENMVRRTRNPIWREEVSPKAQVKIVKGALNKLFEGLAKQESGYDAADYQFDFIGHSMGTMVAANVVAHYPQLRYGNVVFMAAAISVRDFSLSLMPLLRQEHHAMHFYNLMLLPTAEARELTAGGIGPSGSLLEWIDEMYESPPTVLDRTMGKWNNLRAVSVTFPAEARSKMTFRVFGSEPGEPQEHGDFNDVRMCFWRTSFWMGDDWKSHRDACMRDSYR